jgi:glycosyltransferase involved in cell wall biosynthesis
MPCYNSEKYISEAIKSVLNQSYTNFELIVIDDASQDKTIEVIDEFLKLDSRISLYKSKQNFGMPSGPRNRGVKLAKFDWIAFIDSDDVWHPDKLKLGFVSNEIPSGFPKYNNDITYKENVEIAKAWARLNKNLIKQELWSKIEK